MGRVMTGANQWQFKAKRTRFAGDRRFVAWCARIEMARLGEWPTDVDLQYEVYYQFGATEDAALDGLKERVALI
jgi:hypothetical protein